MEHYNGTYKRCGQSDEIIKLDVVGSKSLNIISGTINSPHKPKTSWIARVSHQSDDYYRGEIVLLEGSKSHFPHQEVLVRLGTGGQPVPRLTVRYLPSCDETMMYEQSSGYFRDVSITIACQQGVRPITSVNPCHFIGAPDDLPNKSIGLEEVFEAAGVSVKLKMAEEEVQFIPDGRFRAWDEYSLHQAMETNWGSFRDEPQWALWVLCADKFIEGRHVLGIMFDNFGRHQRQGVAIFYDSIEKDLFCQGCTDKPSTWFDLMKFWTLCHEIGHAFNLRHPFRETKKHDWLLPDSGEMVANIMHYPYFEPWSMKLYFQNFRYEFSKLNLLFLRHAPEHFVRMGDAAWSKL